MRRIGLAVLLAAATNSGWSADSSLTIYNQEFAVVRGTVALDLKQGINEVRFTDTTAHLEPESVILRDPAGKREFQVLEQNYRADPVTQDSLLALFEGQTIDFRIVEDNKSSIVQGKIIRSGYERTSAKRLSPIIEVGGKLRFDLPGTPLFPKLADDTILKPELNWKISAKQPATFDAEIAYVTGKISWKADYNAIAPETGNQLQIVGWVTINNESGKRFQEVKTKLVAGDVHKIIPTANEEKEAAPVAGYSAAAEPVVTEKAFAEYHLYTLQRPLTIRDEETKQVEFVRAEGIDASSLYVCDDGNTPVLGRELPNLDPNYGVGSKPKIAVYYEFKNSNANHLGLPLPAGRMRFYRRDSDQQLEFIGENEIDHTPKDETLRVFTGNAFDVVAERRRVDFVVDNQKHVADESFEIKLRNHKKEPVEVRVVEHLCRWNTWEIVAKSDPVTKKDAQTIEFRVSVKPDQEKIVSYKVHYSRLAPPTPRATAPTE